MYWSCRFLDILYQWPPTFWRLYSFLFRCLRSLTCIQPPLLYLLVPCALYSSKTFPTLSASLSFYISTHDIDGQSIFLKDCDIYLDGVLNLSIVTKMEFFILFYYYQHRTTEPSYNQPRCNGEVVVCVWCLTMTPIRSMRIHPSLF